MEFLLIHEPDTKVRIKNTNVQEQLWFLNSFILLLP